MPETPKIAYKWKEIADLPADLKSQRDSELEALFETWRREKTRFDEAHVVGFATRLNREWAIETGIIENIYKLDRGITQTLIERGIDSSLIPSDSTDRDPELVARMIQAHEDVLEGLFEFVKGQRSLTVGYIRELHSALLRHQRTVTVFDQFGQAFDTELKKGEYKNHPNNPLRPDGGLHQYCPPEHVASEMDRLVALHCEHLALQVPVHVEAAWLHHAFTQIHPFQDGNGRVARAIASLVFLKSSLFPLVVTRDDRPRYIDALETADAGSLSTLIELFSQIQKRALTSAISYAVEARPVKNLDDALDVTRDLLVSTGRIVPTEYLVAKEIARKLTNLANTTLASVMSRLDRDLARADQSYSFTVSAITLDATPALDIVKQMAAQLQFNPNPRDFFDGRVLSLTAGSNTTYIGVIFQSVGVAFRGLVAAASFLIRGKNAIALSDDIFRISYNEDSVEAGRRFSLWLEDSLIRGLAEWRKTLV